MMQNPFVRHRTGMRECSLVKKREFIRHYATICGNDTERYVNSILRDYYNMSEPRGGVVFSSLGRREW